MTVLQMKVKPNSVMGSAPLQNLNILEQLMLSAMDRQEHLPGLATFSGPSGFGKSTAAAYVSSKYNAAYLEVRSVWNKKAFLQAFTLQLGITAAKTIAGMMDQVSEELLASQRPVIIDEFDHVVTKDGLVELVRDIYEQSKSPIVLIGEESLPHKLKKWERFDGRILAYAQAQPATIEDARALNRHYEPDIMIADDLLALIVQEARGSIRRIVTNLNAVSTYAQSEGVETISRKDWGNQPLSKSVAPPTRIF